MAQADATIANAAMPSIRVGPGASGAALEMVIGGYLIAFAVLLITGARLGQTHGYRRVFLLPAGCPPMTGGPHVAWTCGESRPCPSRCCCSCCP